MAVDRRVAIADAAITVIARDGMRALTHRALDRELDLPPGSSSYYLRSRRDVLAAVVARLADRTVAEMLEPAERGALQAGGAPAAADPIAHASQGIAALLVHTLTTRAEDHRARFALAAELVGDPELHAIVTSRSPIRERMLVGAEQMLAMLGIAEPAGRAPALVALTDGILHDRLVGSRAGLVETPAERLAEITRTVGDHLRGALANSAPPTDGQR